MNRRSIVTALVSWIACTAAPATEPLSPLQTLEARAAKIPKLSTESPQYSVCFTIEVHYSALGTRPAGGYRCHVVRHGPYFSLVLADEFGRVTLAAENNRVYALSPTEPGRLEWVGGLGFLVDYTPDTPFFDWVQLTGRTKVNVDLGGVLLAELRAATATKYDAVNRRMLLELPAGGKLAVDLGHSEADGWCGVTAVERTYANGVSLTFKHLRQTLTDFTGSSPLVLTNLDSKKLTAILSRAERSEEWCRAVLHGDNRRKLAGNEAMQIASRELHALLPVRGDEADVRQLNERIDLLNAVIENPNATDQQWAAALGACEGSALAEVVMPSAKTLALPYAADFARYSRADAADALVWTIGPQHAERFHRALLAFAAKSDHHALRAITVLSQCGLLRGDEELAEWEGALGNSPVIRRAWACCRIILRRGTAANVATAGEAGADLENAPRFLVNLYVDALATGAFPPATLGLRRVLQSAARADDELARRILCHACYVPDAQEEMGKLLKNGLLSESTALFFAASMQHVADPGSKFHGEFRDAVRKFAFNPQGRQLPVTCALAIGSSLTPADAKVVLRNFLQGDKLGWGAVLIALPPETLHECVTAEGGAAAVVARIPVEEQRNLAHGFYFAALQSESALDAATPNEFMAALAASDDEKVTHWTVDAVFMHCTRRKTVPESWRGPLLAKFKTDPNEQRWAKIFAAFDSASGNAITRDLRERGLEPYPYLVGETPLDADAKEKFVTAIEAWRRAD